MLVLSQEVLTTIPGAALDCVANVVYSKALVESQRMQTIPTDTKYPCSHVLFFDASFVLKSILRAKRAK